MAAQDDYVRITLRLPPELHMYISVKAARHSVSLNAEIIAAIQRDLDAATSEIYRAVMPMIQASFFFRQLVIEIDAKIEASKDSEEIENLKTTRGYYLRNAEDAFAAAVRRTSEKGAATSPA